MSQTPYRRLLCLCHPDTGTHGLHGPHIWTGRSGRWRCPGIEVAAQGKRQCDMWGGNPHPAHLWTDRQGDYWACDGRPGEDPS